MKYNRNYFGDDQTQFVKFISTVFLNERGWVVKFFRKIYYFMKCVDGGDYKIFCRRWRIRSMI